MEKGNTRAVNARDLHIFLAPKSRFDTWIVRMLEYGFVENQDFCTILGESNGGRRPKDFALTLDCAKEIAMLQRTDKGKQARQYFIECEKAMKQVQPLTEDQLLAQAMNVLNRRLEASNEKAVLLEAEIKKQAPKVQYAEEVLLSESCFTTTTIAKEIGMYAADLNKFLQWMRVQFKHEDHWVLYQNHNNKGLTKTRTHTYTDSEGRSKTSIQMVWTERGRAWIHKLWRDEAGGWLNRKNKSA